MSVRRKELPAIFWQRWWRSRLDLALGRLYVQTHRRLSLNLPRWQRCNGCYIDCRLWCDRKVNRSIGTPKDEIASKQACDRTRTQELHPSGE